MAEDKEHIGESKTQKKANKGLFFWVKRLGKILVFLLGVILFVLHTPAFQNWAAQKASTYFSEKLETTVHIEKLRLSLWGGADLNGFYMLDWNNDSMIVANNFYIDFNSGLWTLLNNSIDIDGIGLENAQLLLSKDSTDILNREHLKWK